MKQQTKFAVLAAIVLWASAFVGIRAALVGYSPEGLALLRFLVASFVISIFYFSLPKHTPMKWKDRIALLTVGAVGIGVYNITLNYGEIAVSSGVASFIISQSPVLSTILAIIFWNEKITWQRALGFFVSLIGVAIISFGEMGKFELTAGLIFMLIAMTSSACYSFLQKPFAKKFKAVEMTSYLIWGGTLFLLMFFPKMQHDVTHAALSQTLIVIYLGIFPAALAYIAWSHTLGELSVSQTVSYLYLLPFVTCLMGWIFLHEIPSPISFVGALIAMCGVWIVSSSYRLNRMAQTASQ